MQTNGNTKNTTANNTSIGLNETCEQLKIKFPLRNEDNSIIILYRII